MAPPLFSAHEWQSLPRAGVTELPDLGQRGAGDAHREGARESDRASRDRPVGEQGAGEGSNLPPQVRVKQEDDYLLSLLDEYFCKGMDTSGPAAWGQVLQRMADGDLPDVGCLNAREGGREEKWTSFDLPSVKFPSTQTSSVKRATLIQNFEADFIRAMGIISPSAALYAQAVIAEVQKALPIYRRRDMETTQKDWTIRLPEEQWHSRAEAVVNLQLQHVGIRQECWDLARMLRHIPPVRLILMTAYRRLLSESPEGVETELTDRSKMHYLDQDAFWVVLSDAWKRHAIWWHVPDQLKESLTAQGAVRNVNAVSMDRPASIRFLDMKMSRRTYMKKIVEVQRAIQEMTWPYQNNRSSVAGGSRALFLGAQTNRGLHNGCVVRRMFQEQYVDIMEKVHALAGCCAKDLPYLGMYVTQLVTGQGLNRQRDCHDHEEYLNYTINFGKYEGGHLEMLRNQEWQSCAVPLKWTEFTADIIEHRVREVTSGERFSVNLF